MLIYYVLQPHQNGLHGDGIKAAGCNNADVLLMNSVTLTKDLLFDAAHMPGAFLPSRLIYSRGTRDTESSLLLKANLNIFASASVAVTSFRGFCELSILRVLSRLCPGTR